MTTKIVIEQRLEFWRTVYEKYKAAYIALIDGGVKNYMIDDRSLTKWDLDEVEKQLEKAEQKIDELEGLLAGGGRRKTVGVVPRDW